MVARLGIATHLHALRHYSATELLTAGVDLPTVAGRLGHCRRHVKTDPRVAWRILVIIATPELFGSRDGGWSAGSGAADGQA